MFGPGMIRAINAAGALQDTIDTYCPEAFGDIVCHMESRWWAEHGAEGDTPEDYMVHNLYDLPTDILEETHDALLKDLGLTEGGL